MESSVPTPVELVRALNTLAANKSDEIKRVNDERFKAKAKPKKPFVRPEHLTDRPLRDSEALEKLKRDLAKKNHPSGKRRR